jgi:integrase/recombinase XerD
MYTEEFVEYLQKEKRMAPNTLEAYKRDVMGFMTFEASRGMTNVLETTSTEIVAYLHSLKSMGKSASTVNRKLASVRSFFNYLLREGQIAENPTTGIKTPKIERKSIEFLSLEEIDKLLASPDESLKGKRDRAILEVLYATGIRVSELIALNTDSVNLRMGFITCDGEGSRARIIPLGRPARAALETYIYDARKQLVREREDEEKALFVNQYGRRITRQGLWKILRDYGEKAQLEHSLTPHTLRNSFAVHMLQNGADLKSLQELMGHDDITATQVYLSATKSRLKDVYDRAHPRA